MERLTIECGGQFVPKEMCSIDRFGGADDCDTCEEKCQELTEAGVSCAECPIQKTFNRLAEYEDLGITPDQTKEMDRLYSEKCEQIKDIEKRLEKEAEDAKAGGKPEISGAYIRAIYIIKEIAEGWPELTDDKLIALAVKKTEQRKEEAVWKF